MRNRWTLIVAIGLTLLATLRGAVAGEAAAADAWEGLWLGRTGGARELDVAVEVGPGAVPVVRISMYGAGIVDESCRGVSTVDGILKANWSPGVGSMAFEVRKSAGQEDRAEGVLFMTPPGQRDPTPLPLSMERKPRAETVPGARTWTGLLETPTGNMDLILTLATTAGGSPVGSLSIPTQSVANMPVEVERNGGAWNIRIPVRQAARLLLTPVDDRLEGRFQQDTLDVAIVFKPGGSKAASAADGRWQTPRPPFPYVATDVVVPTPAQHTLAGTLTLPSGADAAHPVPGVVLATGSGPQDRNEALLGHEPFAVLADALTRAGIAVLRCDDRGVGKSTGSFETATTEDFAADLEAAFAFMQAQPGVDPARVGVLGHSEGAIAAAIVAARAAETGRANPPAFVVLMAGPGVPGHEVLRRQNRAILETARIDPATIATLVEAHGDFLDAAMSGAPDAALLQTARALVALQMEAARKAGQAIPAGAEEAAARSAVAQMRSPWMQTFMVLDPAARLAKVKAPVLALNGKRDVQVVPEQNLPPIRAAMATSGAPLTVREYPELNHLFQRAATGGVGEYASIDTTIEPEVLRDIAAWIRERTRAGSQWSSDQVPSAPAR